ncbi:MAG TPA: Tim44-like domain-containing protein [Bacillota bacterium]|nr:Tim44-like domain-containing protein [Bacillota bacterium]
MFTKFYRKLLQISPFLLALLLLILLELALADGLGGIASGLATFILVPFLLIYSAIITYLIYKKNNQAKELLQKIARIDNTWNPYFLKQNIEKAFFKIQEARMKRDLTMARDYVSATLYEKYKAETDRLIREHRKHILETVRLIETRIVQVADYTDDSKDMMWVHIKGSMIDYIVDDQTGEVVSGNTDQAETLTELWKFIRGPKGWALDEIDPNVSISDFNKFYSFTEND